MKYIQTFEYLPNGPSVGDFIKINHRKFSVPDSRDFYKNNIGVLEVIKEDLEFPYYVRFDKNVPEFSDDLRLVDYKINEIECWAPDMETLKLKIDANKYNI